AVRGVRDRLADDGPVGEGVAGGAAEDPVVEGGVREGHGGRGGGAGGREGEEERGAGGLAHRAGRTDSDRAASHARRSEGRSTRASGEAASSVERGKGPHRTPAVAVPAARPAAMSCGESPTYTAS